MNRSLAGHIGGDTGQWLAAMERRLTADRDRHPSRIDIGLVHEIGSAIEIAADREDLDTQPRRTMGAGRDRRPDPGSGPCD